MRLIQETKDMQILPQSGRKGSQISKYTRNNTYMPLTMSSELNDSLVITKSHFWPIVCGRYICAYA